MKPVAKALMTLHQVNSSSHSGNGNGCLPEVQKLRNELPPEVRDQYDFLIGQDRFLNPVVPAERNSCGGCHVSHCLTSAQQIITVGVAECTSCGRLMYEPKKEEDKKGASKKSKSAVKTAQAV